MIEELVLRYQQKTGKVYDFKNCHIQYAKWSITIEINRLPFSRCLAHIINLATQALIKTRSDAKYYSPHKENHEDIHGGDGAEHNELGLVRVFCVKVCWVIFISKFGCSPKIIQGPFIISTKRAFQRNARRKESSCTPTLAWYESSMEFNLCNAQSCRRTMRGNNSNMSKILFLYLNHFSDSQWLCSPNWTTRKECREAQKDTKSSAHWWWMGTGWSLWWSIIGM